MLDSTLTFAFAISATAAQVAAGAPGEIDIVRDGQPGASIVIPQGADRWTARAAEWLQSYVLRSSGARLEIVGENTQPTGTRISVGHTRLAQRAGIDTAGLKWDGCRLAVKDGVLFLLGRDETPGGTPSRPSDQPRTSDGTPVGEGWTGGAAHGTCRAVVTFLEAFVGVRWFLPVPEGVLVPKRPTITVPVGLDKTITPPFAFLHGRYAYGVGTPAAIANNYRTALKVLSYGGHPYYQWLPAEKYFPDHSEYFALIDGKRTAEGNHLCSSSPQVRQILLAAIRKEFDAGWDWVALGQEDGYVPCECPDCERMDDHRRVMGSSFTNLARGEENWGEYLQRFRTAPCERLASLHLWMIDQCAQSHPDKKVHLLIYWPSLIPSAKLDRKRDNLVGEVAFYNDPYERMVMDFWKDKVHALSVMVTWFDLTTGKGTMGVMMTPQEVAKRMREYAARGVVGLYGIHEANWGLQGPCYYVMGRVAGDPSLDEDDLVNEYCEGVYGRAGDSMKQFFDLLYTRSVNKLGYQWQVQTFGTTEDKHLLLYPLDFLRNLEAILQKAENEAQAERPAVGKMIALTRRQLDYLKLMTHVLISWKAYEAKSTPENRRELVEMRAAFESFRRGVLTGEDRYEQPWPGESDHDWLCKFLVGDGDDANYYQSWPRRKQNVDLNQLHRIAVGFSGSVIREPITANLQKQPPETRRAALAK